MIAAAFKFGFKAFVWLFFTSIAYTSVSQASEITSGQRLLVASYVNQTEQPSIEVINALDDHWIKLTDLKPQFGAEFNLNSSDILFETPIGKTKLRRVDAGYIADELYISTAQLKILFNIRSRFDQSSYALISQVPWRLSPSNSIAIDKRIPDIYAPLASLSFIRSDTQWNQIKNSDPESYGESQLDFGGKVSRGNWLIGATHNTEDNTEINRYFYEQSGNHYSTRVGTNYYLANSQLSPLEFTGAQWAYSNQSIRQHKDFGTNLEAESFLNQDIDRRDKIDRSGGPPGGIAELRLNDKPIAWTRVTLEGNYGFSNVTRPTSSFARLEVYLYETSIYQTPVTKIDLTHSVLENMLPKGKYLVRAGVGSPGNVLVETESNDEENAIGFYYATAGVTEKITLSAGQQRNQEEENERIINAKVAFGTHWAMSIDDIDNGRAKSQAFTLQGLSKKWRMQLDGAFEEADFRPNRILDKESINLYTSYQYRPILQIGLKGRSESSPQNSSDDAIRFIKPWINWRVHPKWNMNVTPSIDGIYQHRLNYYANNRTEFEWYNELSNNTFTASRQINKDLQLLLGLREIQNSKNYFGNLYWYPSSNNQNYLRLGWNNSKKRDNYSMSWNRLIKPGMEFNLSYNTTEEYETSLTGSQQLTARLKYDLAYNGQSLSSADFSQINFTRGAINGQLKGPNGKPLPVDNVGVLINDRIVTQSTANGSYYAGDLKPGIYNVKIDEENLPIEYVVNQPSYIVEVASSAVTSTQFTVSSEYGIAGKVIGGTKSEYSSYTVEAQLYDKKVSNASVSQFGYYRLDGLKPNKYVLILRDKNKKKLGSTETVMLDDFQFEQNIQLSK